LIWGANLVVFPKLSIFVAARTWTGAAILVDMDMIVLAWQRGRAEGLAECGERSVSKEPGRRLV